MSRLVAVLSLVLIAVGGQSIDERSKINPIGDDVTFRLDEQRPALATFRLKAMKRCECLNGGHCHARLRLCQCPLGFSGAHCERPDVQLLVEVPPTFDIQATPTIEKRTVAMAPAPSTGFGAADWLFYAPLAAAFLLLATLIRVLIILLKSFIHDRKEVTVVAKELSSDADNVYTVPLPIQPPPYCECDRSEVARSSSSPFDSLSTHYPQSTIVDVDEDEHIYDEPVKHVRVDLDDYAIVV